MSAIGGPNIVEDGLVLALDAANVKSYPGSGTTWSDLSGNGNNGTLTNGPTFDSGNNGSISFDGINDYVALGTPTILNILGNITIMGWVKLTSFPATNGFATIYEKGFDGTSEQTFFRFRRSASNIDSIDLGTFNNSAGDKATTLTLTGTNFVTIGNWVHLAGQYDTTTWKLFVNGNLESSTVTNQGPYSSTSVSSIGGAFISSGFQRFINGTISGLTIYTRALTASEVLQNYNALKGRFGL
jgi:hypothetical protein